MRLQWISHIDLPSAEAAFVTGLLLLGRRSLGRVLHLEYNDKNPFTEHPISRFLIVPEGVGPGDNPGEEGSRPAEGDSIRRGEDRSRAAGSCVRSTSDSEQSRRNPSIFKSYISRILPSPMRSSSGAIFGEVDNRRLHRILRKR